MMEKHAKFLDLQMRERPSEDLMRASLLKGSLQISQEAAEILLRYYNENLELNIQQKKDESPVTEADRASHEHIQQRLSSLSPSYPVISEESLQIPHLPMNREQLFWLVDPLDGTKEFIRRTDVFSVNIALIYHHQPILGVVNVPFLKHRYWAAQGEGAYFQEGNAPAQRIYIKKPNDTFTVAISRSHPNRNPDWQRFLTWANTLPQKMEFLHCGSAVKLCLIARGLADVYPRFGITGIWDTAAGHCILHEAGGTLKDLKGHELRYGHRASLANPKFVATSPAYLKSWLDFQNKNFENKKGA